MADNTDYTSPVKKKEKKESKTQTTKHKLYAKHITKQAIECKHKTEFEN